ncbi:MAG: CdaR family protein [Bdellovibrionota bacterium]
MKKKTLVFSFIVAFILWTLILGRRDFVYTKVMDLDIIAGTSRSVVMQSADRVRVRVSGPRSSIRRFMESTPNQTLKIDISELPEGVHELDIPANKIDLPVGIKILSMRPNTIKLEIIKDAAGL